MKFAICDLPAAGCGCKYWTLRVVWRVSPGYYQNELLL